MHIIHTDISVIWEYINNLSTTYPPPTVDKGTVVLVEVIC